MKINFFSSSSSSSFSEIFLLRKMMRKTTRKITNSAPEARQKIAHGGTVGLDIQKNSSSGRSDRNLFSGIFFRPIRGFSRFGFETHDFIVGYFLSLLRSFWRRSGVALPLTTILFLAISAMAQTTNGLSDDEIQGQKLAKQLCEMRPTENSDLAGKMEIRSANGNIITLPIRFKIRVTETNWENSYLARASQRFAGNSTNVWDENNELVLIAHDNEQINRYKISQWRAHVMQNRFSSVVEPNLFTTPKSISDKELMQPFADSDFWICDLGLEFFHWPEQKIIKKEFARGRGCMVLESVNPNPSPNGYSRVDCWIDEKTLGIVQAKAYDANGKLLKEFQPKSFKKVNGQWELQDMEIRNVQTGSRSRIHFDLKNQ